MTWAATEVFVGYAANALLLIGVFHLGKRSERRHGERAERQRKGRR